MILENDYLFYLLELNHQHSLQFHFFGEDSQDPAYAKLSMHNYHLLVSDIEDENPQKLEFIQQLNECVRQGSPIFGTVQKRIANDDIKMDFKIEVGQLRTLMENLFQPPALSAAIEKHLLVRSQAQHLPDAKIYKI